MVAAASNLGPLCHEGGLVEPVYLAIGRRQGDVTGLGQLSDRHRLVQLRNDLSTQPVLQRSKDDVEFGLRILSSRPSHGSPSIK